MDSNKKDYAAFFHTDNFVREDKDLKDISKLIFGDIAYFQFLRNGKCTASNGHFAERYDKSKSTISKAISALVFKGYIDSYLDGNRNRTIYVKRSKFASDKSNEGIFGGNSHPYESSSSEEDNNPAESNSPSGSNIGDSKQIKPSKTEMEDLVNKTLKNE